MNENISFTATVLPEDAADKTVKWSTNNKNVLLYSDAACTKMVSVTIKIN